MKALFLLLIVCVTMIACTQQEAESQQSIQDIVGKQSDYVENTTIDKSQVPVTANITVSQTKTEIVETIPLIHKKCRYSTIVNAGCKWNEGNKTNFIMKVKSYSKLTIPGVWFIITGESGGIKYEKRDDEIMSGGGRSYSINYTKLVKEIGKVKKFEILPIEVMNQTEYACLNQEVYTIPEQYCKRYEPINVDGVTGMGTY